MNKSYTNEEQKFLKEVGIRIREFRIKIELSQEKLAFEAGLDRTYIGSVERGERNVAIINLRKIANALEVSLPDLLNVGYENY